MTIRKSTQTSNFMFHNRDLGDPFCSHAVFLLRIGRNSCPLNVSLPLLQFCQQEKELLPWPRLPCELEALLLGNFLHCGEFYVLVDLVLWCWYFWPREFFTYCSFTFLHTDLYKNLSKKPVLIMIRSNIAKPQSDPKILWDTLDDLIKYEGYLNNK